MNIKLKIKESEFDKILTGEKKCLKHGFSKNKKYQRLFKNEIESIEIISAESNKVITRQFKSIEIVFESDKKIIQINLK